MAKLRTYGGGFIGNTPPNRQDDEVKPLLTTAELKEEKKQTIKDSLTANVDESKKHELEQFLNSLDSNQLEKFHQLFEEDKNENIAPGDDGVQPL